MGRRGGTVFVAVVFCAAAVTLGAALALSQAISIDFGSGRRHLRQVAIAPEACGAVSAVHEQLNAFEVSYLAAQAGINRDAVQAILRPSDDTVSSLAPASPSARSAPWPMVRVELDGAAARLDATVAVALPAFPPRIQRYLEMLRSDIASGRTELGDVRRRGRLDAATRSSFGRGRRHAGFASDLVGHQCLVSLGASNF
jgi:hypothetical protein